MTDGAVRRHEPANGVKDIDSRNGLDGQPPAGNEQKSSLCMR